MLPKDDLIYVYYTLKLRVEDVLGKIGMVASYLKQVVN